MWPPITYKDELAQFLARAGQPQVMPTTYSIPVDYEALLEHVAAESDAIWMLKPKWLGAAEGVELIHEMGQVLRSREWIVQEYIANPMLLPEHPHKHGLRVYVLITSLDPLTAYVYPNGLVKFAQERYGLTRAELADRRVHLTNTDLPEAGSHAAMPTMDIASYRRLLRAIGVDDRSLWADIRRMLAYTLSALVAPMLELSSAITDRLGSCFDLLVADVLVDDTLRPWLLECNESPSLATNPTNQPGALDIWRQMKEPLVRDLLSLIGAEEDAFGPDDGDARFIAELRRRRAEPLIPGRGSSGEVPTVSGASQMAE